MKANAERQKMGIRTRASVPQATLDSTVRGKWIDVPRYSALMVITLFSLSRSVGNISMIVGVTLSFFSFQQAAIVWFTVTCDCATVVQVSQVHAVRPTSMNVLGTHARTAPPAGTA